MWEFLNYWKYVDKYECDVFEQTTDSMTIRSRMRLQMVSQNETRSTFTKLNGKKKKQTKLKKDNEKKNITRYMK